MRLIDIEPFETEKDITICQITRWHNGDGYSNIATTNSKDIPTIEAKPVKHGRWEYGDYYDIGDVCSECDWDSGMVNPTLRDCPNCGAKMDLEASE